MSAVVASLIVLLSFGLVHGRPTPSENSIEIESSQHARILVAVNTPNDQHHTITLDDNGSEVDEQNTGFMLCHTNDDALTVGMTYALC